MATYLQDSAVWGMAAFQAGLAALSSDGQSSHTSLAAFLSGPATMATSAQGSEVIAIAPDGQIVVADGTAEVKTHGFTANVEIADTSVLLLTPN